MNVAQQFLNISRPVTYVVIIAAYIVHTADLPWLRALCAVSAGALLVSSALIVGWIPASMIWRRRLLWAEVAIVILLNGAVSFYRIDGPMAFMYAPLLVTMVLQEGRQVWIRSLCLVIALWLLSSIPLWFGSPLTEMLFQAIGYGAFLLFAVSISMLMRTVRDEKERSEALLQQVNESQAALQRAHRQLQESAARQQHMAVLEERQRLAREIHDSVAHTLTALVVQVQAGRRLLDRAPDEAAATIRRCEDMAREALQETRRAVRALHPAGLEQQTEVEALRRLGNDFGIATGIQVEVTADPAAAALLPDPDRLEQLYRIFQEALTNAHRHGQARRVTAALSLAGDQLRLSIANDGAPPARLDPGVGLKSMNERARSLGGTVFFEAGERGLNIRVMVPVKQEAVS